MSSSSTETMIDVTMPQMGVSVAEGTVVEWKKQVGDWVEADEIIASISTDKIDTDVESPASGRVAEIIVGVGETVDVGTVMARIATDARPGEAHASENGDLGTGEAAAAIEAPGEAGESARRPATGSVRQGQALLAGGDADRRRAQHRSLAGRGHRPRRARAQEGRAGVPRGRRRGGRAADAHRDPVPARRAARSSASRSPGCSGSRRCRSGDRSRAPAPSAGGQPLSRMRQAIGSRMVQSLQTARDLHDHRRGGHEPHRGRPQGREAQLPALPGAGDDRDPARVPEAQRHARGRPAHGLHDAVHLGIAVVAGQRRPDRPDHPRRAGPERRGPGQAHQGHRRPRAQQPAHAGRGAAAARSPSPTPAATARSWPRR